jgi:hypothetical protein
VALVAGTGVGVGREPVLQARRAVKGIRMMAMRRFLLGISIGGDDIGDFWRSKRKIEESWRTYGASDKLTACDSDVRMKAVNGLASTVVKGS